jgi:DNA-binding transcriptional MerR regulator
LTLCVALSRSYRDPMRVYELARALGLPSSDVIARLRADGEWVDSHLSAVPEPVANRYLPERPPAVQRQRMDCTFVGRRPSCPRPWSPPVERRPARRPWFKRRPGPRPMTMQQPARDEYDDPVNDLRYEPEITTRDVSKLLGVTQATVRRWVARGYISPVGKLGPSNLFSTSEVLAAHDDIEARRKATGRLRLADRIRPKHYDAVVDVGEAAQLIDVSPATIRSWIHRGHLTPLRSSNPRAIRLRLGDVITAAQSRQLSRRSARHWAPPA